MYHLFRKTVTLKSGKQVKRWYYWYYDSNGKRKNRVCPNCVIKADAEAYIKTLPLILPKINSFLINDITREMFLLGSDHVDRREKFGKKSSIETLRDCRRYIIYIQQLWGDISIIDLNVRQIISSLISIDRSSSWKNRIITILKEVYAEANWQGITVILPVIPRFQNNYKKADILTTEEIQQLFVAENFPSYDVYLLFFLCLLCGLRLGEARAIQFYQIDLKNQILLLDGFCTQNCSKTTFLKSGSEKNPKWRCTLLPDMAIKLLEPYFEKKYQTTDFLFQKNGRPYREEYLEDCFKRALIKTGINNSERKIIPHSLRYTYVTRMRRFAPIELVRRIVGHTSEGMTEYYTRFELENSVTTVLPALDAANKLMDTI